MSEPFTDVAHLGHVEMFTDRFAESLDFFTRVFGLKLSADDGDSAYLRAWDDYEFHSLKLTRHHTTGVGHIGYRAASPEALERRVKAIEASGYVTHGWADGDLGHGPAFRFEDPFGHVFELYWETVRYQPDADDRPALKNMSSRFHAQGASPRRIDHLNLLSEDVTVFRDFMQTCLGSRVTEQIRLDNGRLGGCIMSPMPPISARTSCAPPTSSLKTACISRPGRTSTPSRAPFSCMSGSRPATGWNWPMPAPG